MQTTSPDDMREWLDDFDAKLRGCPVELRRREKARAEREHQQKLIAQADAHERAQKKQTDNAEA